MHFRYVILGIAVACLPTAGYCQTSPLEHAAGLLPSAPAQLAAAPQAPRVVTYGTLRPEVDLENLLPTPQDQGNSQDSCAAWAVAYAAKTFTEFGRYNVEISSPAHQFSPSFIFNQVHNNASNCSGGITYLDALNFLANNGVATLAEMPYNSAACDPSVITSAVKTDAKKQSIVNFGVVRHTLADIKANIDSGSIVLAGIKIDDKFEKWSKKTPGDDVTKNYEPEQPLDFLTDSQGNVLGHAIVLVGYSDSKGAFRAMNSWGTGWGDGGFFWISYNAFSTIALEELYTISDHFYSYSNAEAASSAVQKKKRVFADQVAGVASFASQLNARGSVEGAFFQQIAPSFLNVVLPPSASISLLGATYNSNKDLQFNLKASLAEAEGRTFQIVVTFEDGAGNPIRMPDQNVGYTTTLGDLAWATHIQKVDKDSYQVGNLGGIVPHDILNRALGGDNTKKVEKLVAHVFIDGAQITTATFSL